MDTVQSAHSDDRRGGGLGKIVKRTVVRAGDGLYTRIKFRL